jgi:hypothetical protein
VLPEEEEAIKENARQAGLSVAAYLRNVGMGYRIQGVIDAELVGQLAKINADQGRLGGLLKLWLSNSEKLGSHDPDQMRRVIHGRARPHRGDADCVARTGEQVVQNLAAKSSPREAW